MKCSKTELQRCGARTRTGRHLCRRLVWVFDLPTAQVGFPPLLA